MFKTIVLVGLLAICPSISPVLRVQQTSPASPEQGTPPPAQRPSQGWSHQQTSQAWATEKLAKSPRRNQWVSIKSGDRTLKGWVVYPQVKGKVPVVLVMHEVFGLTDSTRNTADQIAALGYIAITPDMLSGHGPNGGNSDSFEPPYSASNTVTYLTDPEVNSDFDAWGDYAKSLPGSNGTFAIVGLSWGGGAAFRYATTARRKDLKALFVFYDVGPPKETQKYAGAPAILSVDAIDVPVYGFYAENDKRPAVTIQATTDAMTAAHKTYEPVTYPGADHAFMRLGEDPNNPNPANAAACRQAMQRLKDLLKTM